jgi:hypothetical protein
MSWSNGIMDVESISTGSIDICICLNRNEKSERLEEKFLRPFSLTPLGG